MIPKFLAPEALPYASVEVVVIPVTSVTIVPVRPAMTTALNDRVVVGADNLVRVCAWCVAPVRLAEIHRAHRCSDGVCPACLVRLEQEVA